MLNPEDVSKRLVALRVLRGFSQDQFAELVADDGHGKKVVGRLERCETPLTWALLQSLTRHLNVPAVWFEEPNLDRLLARADPDMEGIELMLGRLDVNVRQALVELTHLVTPDERRDAVRRVTERAAARLEQTDEPSAPEPGSPSRPHPTDPRPHLPRAPRRSGGQNAL